MEPAHLPRIGPLNTSEGFRDLYGTRRWTPLQQGVSVVAAAVVAIGVAAVVGEPLLLLPFFVIPLLALTLVRSNRDAVSLLSLFAALLLLLPSPLIFEPLGAAGTPANVLAILMLWFWAHGRLVGSPGFDLSRQPVRVAMLLLGATILASYAAVAFRPVTPVELVAADRGLLALLGAAGIALMAADGITERSRLDTLLRRVVLLGGVLAVVGQLQFFTGLDIAGYVRLPGLHVNYRLLQIDQRSNFRRVQGTATHAIEFGVVLAIIFPLALHYALHAAREVRTRSWLMVAAIGLAVPMSLSRSAFVVLAVEAVVLLPGWSPSLRRRALAVAAAAAVAMRLAIPGLLGTVKSLFTNISTDPSTTGRTRDYAEFGSFFKDTPILGRGFFTFLPERYIILDNQFLLSLLEIGIVGTVALVGLFLVAIGSAHSARRHAPDEETRHLGRALAAGLAGALVAFGTFDALSFPMQTGLVFLLIGCAGALRGIVLRGERAAVLRAGPAVSV